MNPEMQAMYNTCGGRESRSATAKMLMLESFPLLLISTSKIPFALFMYGEKEKKLTPKREEQF
jgi:hypothetical protein